MFVVVDNHSCNVGSVVNILKRIGVEAKATDQPDLVSQASRIILPGVGAFDTAMTKLNQLGLKAPLNERVLDAKVPILGICLGMQLLGTSSEEGKEDGLGWIPGEIKKFETDKKLPHMGWNFVNAVGEHKLLVGFERPPKFYFVHSYHFHCESTHQVGKTEYGESFNSVVEHENIVGAQFHPEKSHKYGMKFLTNFMEHY